jgi:hypothetical protein
MIYTLEDLKRKNFAELKQIGNELNVLPEGDRRCRQTWIEAIAGVNPPLLALLEVSPAGEVPAEYPIIETVENSPGVEVEPVQDAPLESKLGRIVYPRQAQGALGSAAKTKKRVQEPIEEVQALVSFKIGDLVKSLTKQRGIKNKSLTGTVVLIHPSGGVRVTFFGGGTLDYSRSQLKDLIVQEPPIAKVVNILKSKSPEILSGIAWHFFNQSPEGFKEVLCSRIWDESEDIGFVVEIIRSFCANRLGGCNFDNIFEIFQRVLVGQEEIQAQELARNEKLQARKPIRETVENPPGAEAQRQESLESKFGRIVYPKSAAKTIAQNEKVRPQLDRAQSADVHNRRSHPAKSDRDSSGAKTEALGSQEGDRVLAVARDCETDRGRVLPDQSIKLVNFTEAARLENETRMSQSAIAQATENSPGVKVSFSDRKRYWADRGFFLIPEAPAEPEENSAVELFDGCIYCTSPEYESLRNETYRCYICEPEPDRIPIAQATENSPGVKVEQVEDLLAECCECFGDGYIEDEFGLIKFCQCKTAEPIREKTQRAIAPAGKISLNPKSDRNPILTGICLSDRFLNCYRTYALSQISNGRMRLPASPPTL